MKIKPLALRNGHDNWTERFEAFRTEHFSLSGHRGEIFGKTITTTLPQTAQAPSGEPLFAPQPGPQFLPLTAGNIVVYRVGAVGSLTALTNAATAVFLDEYTTSGAYVQTIEMPVLDSGANHILSASGTATSEGLLTLSADGHYLILTGYDSAPGTAGSVVTTTTGTVVRVIGRVDASGNVDTSTTSTAFSGQNIRGAASDDGQTFWFTGSGTTGLVTTEYGGSGAGTIVSNTATNLRGVAIFDGQLYLSTGAGTAFRVGAVGSGLPTTTGQTTTNIPGGPTSGSTYQFFFADLTGAVAGVDTLYMADDAANQLQKYTFNGTVWAADGTITISGVRGLTGSVSGGNVSLYATSSTAIFSFTDMSGYDGTMTGAATSIVTANVNTAFRGIAFAPTPIGGGETQTVQFSPITASQVEGDTGTAFVTFTVTRTGGTTGQLDFSGTVALGTADAADFAGGVAPTAFNGSIPAGQPSVTVTIEIRGDDIVEGNDTFTLTLDNVSNVTANVDEVLGINVTATGTITNDDAAGTLAIDNVSMSEGNGGTTNFSFTVTRSGGDDGIVSADYEIILPGGMGGADATDIPGSLTGTVTFADGVTSQTITVGVAGDVTFEPDESFTVFLDNPQGGATITDDTGAGLITNDDPAPAGTLNIADAIVTEGNSGPATITFTVTRAGGSAGAVTADYVISAPGGAGNADSADFVTGSVFTGQVSFANGVTSATITIDVEGDTVFEADEAFTVTLSNAQGGALLGDNIATGTITNDDVAVGTGTVSIADATLVEGNAGTSLLILTVTRTGGAAAFTVDFATANGGDPTHASATAGSDYAAQMGTVSFGAGQDMATIEITINGDAIVELSEEFTVTLSNATNGATITDNTAIATIGNDDIQPSSVNLLTQNFDTFRGGGFAPVPAAGQLDSDIYIASGFDDPAVVYGGTVTSGDLARGETAAAVTQGGIFALDQGGGDWAWWVQPSGSDFTPGNFEIRIANTTGVAADTFAVAYDLLVRNDAPRANSLNLSWSTDGTNFFALNAFDYTSAAAADALGVVTVGRSGQFTTTSSVAAGGFLYLRFTGNDVSGADTRDEFGLDNIVVNVAAGSAAPTVSVGDVSVNESAGTMTFTVTRSNVVGGAFSVNYATANGTATAGSDYTATSGTLNFADNQLSTTVTVAIGNDGTPELDETVLLNLSGATNGAVIADGQGVGTIVNDDGTPIQVSINDVSIVEGHNSSQNLVFTVTRTGGTGAFDVNFETADGTAISVFGPGQDYVTTTGTINFLAGQNIATISVPILGDTASEPTETFLVQLTSATNNAVIVDGQGVGTIVNDEGIFIHDIQGTAYFSPLLAVENISTFNTASAGVVSVTAIVTAVDNVGNRQGYYIQEEIVDWDGNRFTSEGIFVMTRNDAGVGNVVSGIAVGDLVTVNANVMEYQGFSSNMPITALVNASAIVVSTGNVLPTLLLDAGHAIPSSIMTGVTPVYTDSSDDAGDSFDASLYGLSYWETVEGMLVTIPDMVVADGFVSTSGGQPFMQAYSTVHADATQINSRGGYTIAGDPPNSPPDTANPEDGTTNGGRVLHDGDVNPDIIELDWTGWADNAPAGLTTGASMGDLLGDITGIIDFEFTDRKLFVTDMEPGGWVNTTPTIETTVFGDDSRSLTVATFNVENLDPTDGAARFTAIANAIANNLNSPDIICIEEMQDNNGANSSGGSDASTTWGMLVAALNLATGKVYQWVDQEPTPGAEGGEPGGNIRVGFLYDTGRVTLGTLDANATLAERRQYTDRIGDGVRDAGDLIAYSDNMLGAEINTSDWATTRRSLLGEFHFNGNTVYVTANHWPAKGGSGDFWQFDQDLASGDPDNSDWAQRNQVAQDVYSMLNLVQTGNPNAGIVAGGDFNDFYFYRPLEVVTGYVLPDGSARAGGARFDNLTLTLSEAERYTYTFDGRSQAIDHVIANQLLSGVATYDVVHLSTGFNPTGSPALSDHDPGIATFDFRSLSEVLVGTAGADQIDGFGGDDHIFGAAGNDTLTGGAGTDILEGGADNDTYFVESALDQVIEVAGGGYDYVVARTSYALGAGASVELLSTDNNAGTAAIDLTGNELANILVGNAGANWLDGGTGGGDLLLGLGGDDTYFVDADDRVLEDAGGGYDYVVARTNWALGAGASVELMSTDHNAGTAAIDLTGNELTNILVGNAGANALNGGLGGTDLLQGLGGDDTYFVDADDMVIEDAGGGYDYVVARTSFGLGAGVSVELMSTDNNAGTAAINLTGNELANILVGNDGANTLDGGAGSDVLVGLLGADSFAFTTALGAGNVDTITDFLSGTDRIQLDDAVFAGIGGLGALNASAFVTGSQAADADDRIIYNSANGQLLFDADGAGGTAAVHFATLSPGLTLSAGDFMVI